MSLNSKHPKYEFYLPDWIVMNDTYAGERTIKAKTTEYLPATSGQIADGPITTANTDGAKAYAAYVTRARFHGFTEEAVNTAVGVMHQKPAVIELPDSMEDLRESATLEGEGLLNLLRKINTEQLKTGRIGLIADMPLNPPPDMVMPYIETYDAEDIINWDKGQDGEFKIEDLQLVVLNESGFQRVASTDSFEWKTEERFRVLIIKDGVYQVGSFRQNENGIEFNEADLVIPSISGKTLTTIPFTFINSKDIIPDPDAPPLLRIANQDLGIYRGEADYRQSLFLQGQDTLIIIGGSDEEQTRTGAGARIDVPINGDAKYIGVDSTGLSEQREALQNDQARITQTGANLSDTTGNAKESGDALRIRVASKTVTLTTIALTGAAGLESSLKDIAVWTGANPDEVKVTPNLDFAVDELSGKDLLDYTSAKVLGAPISWESIHRLAQKKELTSMDFEEEMDKIKEEEALNLGGTGTGVDDEA